MRIVAILFLAAGIPIFFIAWYCVEGYVNPVAGYIYWLRVLVFLFAYGYFGFLMNFVKPFKNVHSKLIEKVGTKNRNSTDAVFCLVPSVVVMAIANTITQNVNNSLLKEYHKEVLAVVTDCYYLKKDSYCNYSFFANGIEYENKFYNNLKREEKDSVEVWYYPQNPNINAVKESVNRSNKIVSFVKSKP